MADVSARPRQAKSAPVSRFELNPQLMSLLDRDQIRD